MSKRIIHTLSDEDLVALAAGADPEEIVEKLTDAAQFVYELNIKHGDHKVPAQVIYHAYKHWNGWDQKRQSKPLFFRDFGKLFDSHRVTDGIVYLLNPKPFDLSQENYWHIRKELRDAKTKKTDKPTRQSKTPKS